MIKWPIEFNELNLSFPRKTPAETVNQVLVSENVNVNKLPSFLFAEEIVQSNAKQFSFIRKMFFIIWKERALVMHEQTVKDS